MTWQIWSAFFVIETALCLTPGPAVLLVLSQVVLSLQLSFAVFPLVIFTSDPHKMGPFANSLWVKVAAWTVAIVIAVLNLYLLPTLARLLWQTFAG